MLLLHNLTRCLAFSLALIHQLHFAFHCYAGPSPLFASMQAAQASVAATHRVLTGTCLALRRVATDLHAALARTAAGADEHVGCQRILHIVVQWWQVHAAVLPASALPMATVVASATVLHLYAAYVPVELALLLLESSPSQGIASALVSSQGSLPTLGLSVAMVCISVWLLDVFDSLLQAIATEADTDVLSATLIGWVQLHQTSVKVLQHRLELPSAVLDLLSTRALTVTQSLCQLWHTHPSLKIVAVTHAQASALGFHLPMACPSHATFLDCLPVEGVSTYLARATRVSITQLAPVLTQFLQPLPTLQLMPADQQGERVLLFDALARTVAAILRPWAATGELPEEVERLQLASLVLPSFLHEWHPLVAHPRATAAMHVLLQAVLHVAPRPQIVGEVLRVIVPRQEQDMALEFSTLSAVVHTIAVVCRHATRCTGDGDDVSLGAMVTDNDLGGGIVRTACRAMTVVASNIERPGACDLAGFALSVMVEWLTVWGGILVHVPDTAGCVQALGKAAVDFLPVVISVYETFPDPGFVRGVLDLCALLTELPAQVHSPARIDSHLLAPGA